MKTIFKDSEGRLVEVELLSVVDYKDYELCMYYTETQDDVPEEEEDFIRNKYFLEIDEMITEELAGQADYYYEMAKEGGNV